MLERTSRWTSIAAVLASVMYGTILATGFLALAFVATATIRGYSPIELYAETFPSSRGGGITQFPPFVYGIFFLYVIGAVEIAIFYRRRLSHRRHTPRNPGP